MKKCIDCGVQVKDGHLVTYRIYDKAFTRMWCKNCFASMASSISQATRESKIQKDVLNPLTYKCRSHLSHIENIRDYVATAFRVTFTPKQGMGLIIMMERSY